MNTETIERRIEARDFANTVFDLMHEERNNFDIEQDRYFWEVLIGKSPLNKLLEKKEIKSKLTPMSEEESIAFDLFTMPCWKHRHMFMKDIELEYLMHITEDGETTNLLNKIRRYLASDRIQKELN